MANTRNTTNRNRAGTQRHAASDRPSRTTSRTGAWEQVKKHPILAATAAGVLAMGVGAYALLRKNGGNRRRNDD
jgi:hypothetical protein